MRNLSVLVLALTTSSAFAATDLIKPFGNGVIRDDISDYQIGDVWGKVPLTRKDLSKGSEVLKKAAQATARYGGSFGAATGFYMGKFNGQHILGSNHHVVDGVGCRGATLRFPFLGKHGVKVKCLRTIGHWSDADFGLIVLDIPKDEEHLFEGVGVNFAFDKKIERGTKLLTVGFGVAQNPGQWNMMVNVDDDCKVYSETEDFRFLKDPDTMNPASYNAWSFSHGCDISHGDSGSAFFDRETGDMLGIVWTAATPKDRRVLTRKYLDNLSPASEDIWTKLGYTVPAAKVGEVLKSIESTLPADDALLIEAILGH